jgi:hypothetical protein
MVIEDQGHSGNGGPQTVNDFVAITVNSVNDAPVLDNTGSMTLASILEDDTTSAGDTVASIVASAGGDRITDVDAGAVEGIAVIGVDDSNGQWQYDTGSGWVAFGAVANNSAVLLDPTASIRFVPNANYNGSAGNLTFRAWDQSDGNTSGDTGVDVSTSGGATAYSVATETATLSVTAVNDAPVNTVPGPQTTSEDNPLVFSTGGGNGLSIADVDAGVNPVEVTLSVTSGRLTLSQFTGLAFSTGDGTSDASMTFTGNLSDINAALDGLVYAPNLDYSGGDSLAVAVNDLGNVGGGQMVDADALPLTITFVGSPPVARGDLVNLFGSALLSVGASNGVLANDSDVDPQSLSALLLTGPQHGSLVLNPDGSFQYVPAAGYFGFDSFRYTVDDGILTSAPATVTILVVPGVGAPPDLGNGSDPNDTSEESAAAHPDAGREADNDSNGDESTDEEEYLGELPTAGRRAPDAARAPLGPILSEAEDALGNGELDMLIGGELSRAGGRSANERGALRGSTAAGRSASDRGTLGALSEALSFDAGLLFDHLNDLEETLSHETEAAEWIIGTAASATTVLSAGYVAWVVRGGYLFAGLLSSMPTWYRLDPLPVLQTAGLGFSGAAKKKTNKDDDKSLVELVEKDERPAAHEPETTTELA